MLENKQPLVKMVGIEKYFPGVVALGGVDLTLSAGEVLGLVGENGSGKSTLVKILGGIYKKDAGEILINGQLVEITSPDQAQTVHGIVEVHQELNMFPQLAVSENIFMNRYNIPKGKLNLKWHEMHEAAKALLHPLDPTIDPREMVKNLDICQQHIVEIARALSFNSKVLILDEPTSAMPENEINKLFSVVKRLSGLGMGIIYISHHIGEFFEISEKIMVLRDGKLAGQKMTKDTNEEEIIGMMTGVIRKAKGNIRTKSVLSKQSEIMTVKDLDIGMKERKVSFSLRNGEILGVTGLLGCGMHQIGKAIFGIEPKSSGTVLIDGKETNINNPNDAMKSGISYLPEDRKKDSLVLNMSVKKNLTLAFLQANAAKLGIIDRNQESRITKEYIEKMNVKTPSYDQEIQYLSGGNQQKTVIARWLICEPRVLIISEPTRGIDVGAKTEIYDLLFRLNEQGMSIIIISSEIPEVHTLADRLLVMRRGKIGLEKNKQDISCEELTNYVVGGI